MKSLTARLLATFCLMAALARADVSLLPGTISGSISVTAETVKNGSVYASATDGSASASSSFTGSSYSIVVPAGKSWKLNFYVYTDVPSGAYIYTSVSLPDTIGPVAGDQTVTNNVSLSLVRVVADVQVANGTLTSIPTLQSYGNTGGTAPISFNSYSQYLNYVFALPATGVSVSGTATVKSTANQTSTQTLSSKSVNVPTAGATVSWPIDAAFTGGSIQGTMNLLGSQTPNGISLNLYNPSGSNVGSTNLNGNGTFEFTNLLAGQHSLYSYVYYTNAQLYIYRYPTVVAGSVVQLDINTTVALGQTAVNLTGFLTSDKVSSGSLNSNWTAPVPNPDSTSMSSYASLNSSGGFTSVFIPGKWSPSQVTLYSQDYSVAPDYFYSQVSVYDAKRANTPVTFAAGDNLTLAPFNINTTQTDITFDVIEPAGAATETKISSPYISGYANTYDSSNQYTGSVSFYAANFAAAQAKPRVRIIGAPGTYNVNAYGTVNGSQVSFGNFTLELKAPLSTPTGTKVAVDPGAGVTLVFDNVTTTGVTSASQLPVGPALPPGYTGLSSNSQSVYYSVSTTAKFSGYVDVTVAYDPASVPSALAGNLHLFYYDNPSQTWVDVTVGVDSAGHKVTGTAPALSLFALGLPHAPVITSLTLPTNPLKATALAFAATFTDSDPGEKHTASWSWGDGSADTTGTVNESAGTIAATHTFTGSGTFHGVLTLKDITGNSVTKTFDTVMAGDTTAPVITVSANVTAEATGPTGAAVTFTATALDDTDGNVTVTTLPASGSTFALGTTTVTATATDAAGNTATKTFTVTVKDTTAPTLTLPANIAVEATSPAGAPAFFTATATDIVTVSPTISYSKGSGSTFAVGTTTVTVTATDGVGLSSSGNFTITVRDTTPPTIATRADVIAEATSSSGASVTFALPAASDLAGNVTVTSAPASGTQFALGNTTVTATAKDSANLTATSTFKVIVQDTIAPVITAPTNIIAEATSSAGAPVIYNATVADAVGATLTSSKASGTVFPIGTTTVKLNAVDTSGNPAVEKTFTVTVRDTAGPVITAPNVVVEASGDEDGTKATFTVTALDAVSGVRPVTLSRSSGSKFPLGVTTVTATSKDALGNTTTVTFTVTVRDTTPPKLAVPKNITVSTSSATGTKVTFKAEAEDTVSDKVTITYSPASGSTFPIGTTVVTVIATDAAGNAAKGTFTVTVTLKKPGEKDDSSSSDNPDDGSSNSNPVKKDS